MTAPAPFTPARLAETVARLIAAGAPPTSARLTPSGELVIEFSAGSAQPRDPFDAVDMKR